MALIKVNFIRVSFGIVLIFIISFYDYYIGKAHSIKGCCIRKGRKGLKENLKLL